MSILIRNDRTFLGFSASAATTGGITGATEKTVNSTTTPNLTASYDPNSWFTLATGQFLPTKAGWYLVGFSCYLNLATSGVTSRIRKNGGAAIDVQYNFAGTDASGSTTIPVYMNGSTDYLTFTYDPNGDTSYSVTINSIFANYIGP